MRVQTITSVEAEASAKGCSWEVRLPGLPTQYFPEAWFQKLFTPIGMWQTGNSLSHVIMQKVEEKGRIFWVEVANARNEQDGRAMLAECQQRECQRCNATFVLMQRFPGG